LLQPLVARAVRSPQDLLALLGEAGEVEVGAAPGRERACLREEVASPGEVVRVFAGGLPVRLDPEQEGRLALRERAAAFRLVPHRPAESPDVDRAERGWPAGPGAIAELGYRLVDIREIERLPVVPAPVRILGIEERLRNDERHRAAQVGDRS